MKNIDQEEKQIVKPKVKQKHASFILLSFWIIGIECFVFAFIAPYLVPGPKGTNVPHSDAQSIIMFTLIGISMSLLLSPFIFIIFSNIHNKRKTESPFLLKDKSKKLVASRKNLGFILVAITGFIILSVSTLAIVVSSNNYLNLQIHNLSNSDVQIVSDAANALVKIGDVRAVSPLLSILKDEDNNARYLAAMALIKLGDISAEHDLIKALFEFGNIKMAEIYLNSGNDQLKDAATVWGESNGYQIETFFGGSGTPKWGSR